MGFHLKILSWALIFLLRLRSPPGKFIARVCRARGTYEENDGKAMCVQEVHKTVLESLSGIKESDYSKTFIQLNKREVFQ